MVGFAQSRYPDLDIGAIVMDYCYELSRAKLCKKRGIPEAKMLAVLETIHPRLAKIVRRGVFPEICNYCLNGPCTHKERKLIHRWVRIHYERLIAMEDKDPSSTEIFLNGFNGHVGRIPSLPVEIKKGGRYLTVLVETPWQQTEYSVLTRYPLQSPLFLQAGR